MLSATRLVFTLVFSNFFDAMGTMTGLAKNAGLAYEDGTFLFAGRVSFGNGR